MQRNSITVCDSLDCHPIAECFSVNLIFNGRCYRNLYPWTNKIDFALVNWQYGVSMSDAGYKSPRLSAGHRGERVRLLLESRVRYTSRCIAGGLYYTECVRDSSFRYVGRLVGFKLLFHFLLMRIWQNMNFVSLVKVNHSKNF